MTVKKLCLLPCLYLLLAGCEKQKYEDFIEPEPEPVNIISYTNDDSKDVDPDRDSEDIDEGQNLLTNGGLEEWETLWGPEMPKRWSLPSNDYVKREKSAHYDGNYCAKMQSLEKGKTARLEQKIQVTPNKKIRIRFHYAITQWKDKGARTYCYFRTQSAESSTISAEAMNHFYDANTLHIIRGGGYGLTYFPHELNKWLTFDETIEVPSTANYFAFGINSYYGTIIYVDDCWITNVAN